MSHEQIDVARIGCVSRRHRSEYPHISRAVFFGNSNNLLAFFQQDIFQELCFSDRAISMPRPPKNKESLKNRLLRANITGMAD